MSSELMVKELDKAAGEAYELTRAVAASFSGALSLARVTTRIRNALTTELVSEAIMPLKDTQFGWRTDGKSYSVEQIRDVWVSACMVGAKPVNNEVNIISGQCYLAKNYFERVIKEFPELTEFNAIPGEVKMSPAGALVSYSATWKLKGKSMERHRTGPSAIPVRLNNGMGADGALGKARRKFLADVLTYITGTQFNDGEVDDVEPGVSVVSNAPAATAQSAQKSAALPAPAKTTPTQTQAVTEKLKKTVAPPVAEVPTAPVEEKAPWDGEDQPTSGDVGESGQTETTVAPAPEPVQEVKKVDPPKPAQQKPAAQSQKPVVTQPKHPAAPPAPPVTGPTSEDVIEKDTIGQIAAIKASKPGSIAPYTVMSDNGTQYVTMDRKMAEKAKGYKDTNVPVAIEYTIEASGRHMIVDVLPAELAGDPNDFSSDGPPGDQEPA